MTQNIRLGHENVSSAQRRYLERAKDSPSHVSRSLYAVIEDDDIKNGVETLHPDWIDIYDTHKNDVRTEVPEATWSRIESFFHAVLPYDPMIGRVNPLEHKLCFLLGAGASKPAPSNIPTVKELLPQLLERARRLDRDDVNKLADYCEERRIDNIEDLLTAAQLATFSSRNPTVLGLLNFLLYRGEGGHEYDLTSDLERRVRRRPRDPVADLSSVAFLQDTLQVLFGLLSSTMIAAHPNRSHTAISEYAKSHESTVIVTTNYDCCMDLALGQVAKDFFYRIEFSNAQKGNMISPKIITRLIKLHGSLNWYYCETCQEVHLVDIRSARKGF